MTECPCKNCGDRFIGCHGKCEKYKAWRAEYDEINKKRNLDILLDRHFKETKSRLRRVNKYAKKQ